MEKKKWKDLLTGEVSEYAKVGYLALFDVHGGRGWRVGGSPNNKPKNFLNNKSKHFLRS